jgi:hypothetical protein
MLTSQPTASTSVASALATYRAVRERLETSSHEEFADVDPRAMEAIPVPVRVTSRVVSRLQRS